MPNSEHSAWEINAQEPDNFDQKIHLGILLAFEGTAEKPRFGFASMPLNGGGLTDFRLDVAASGVRFFQSLEEFREAFYETILIEDDTFVEVRTLGDHFFWSKKVDAIMTAHSRKRLYGDLKYWNSKRMEWRERETHDQSTCTLISFKAKHNKDNGLDGETRHKFSYNVRIRNKNDHMVEYEIDPDIQNPKVRKYDQG